MKYVNISNRKGDEIMAIMTTSISIQIDKEDKEKATAILQKLGVSMSGLFNMTIKQLIMRERIPFDVSIPKEEYALYSYFTKEELEETAKELQYIKSHLNEYRENNKWEDLKSELINDEI